MPKLNVYVPADLYDAIKAANINTSRVCQDALRDELKNPGPSLEEIQEFVKGYKAQSVST